MKDIHLYGFLNYSLPYLHFGDLNYGLSTDVNKTGLYREGTNLRRMVVDSSPF